MGGLGLQLLVWSLGLPQLFGVFALWVLGFRSRFGLVSCQLFVLLDAESMYRCFQTCGTTLETLTAEGRGSFFQITGATSFETDGPSHCKRHKRHPKRHKNLRVLESVPATASP